MSECEFRDVADADRAVMDYDDILEHLGELGRWNVTNQLLIWMGPFIAGVTVLVYSFTGNQVL